jgi:hypothetical protein
MDMAVWNRTRCTYLGTTLLTLSKHFPRTLRHINSNGIPEDCALWISPCQGVYTVGMRKPVDIVFLDGNMQVVKLYRNFPPGCFIDPEAGAVSALELPPERLQETGTAVGDILAIDPW